MDLNLLLVLDALLRERNVTRAAKRLGRTQPTVSGALARLREALDDPLFVRTGAGMTPTNRAAELGEAVARALAEIRGAFERAGDFDPKSSSRRFAIEVSEEAGAIVVPGLLRAVREAAPSVRVAALRFEGHEASPGLRNGDVDLSIGIVRGVAPPFEHADAPLGPFVLVGRRDHPLLAKRPSLAAYTKASHVLVSPRGRAVGGVDLALRERGLARHDVTIVPSLGTALMTIAQTDALLATSEAVARAIASWADVTIAPMPFSMPDLALNVVWHSRVTRDPGHAWLRERVMEAIAGVRGEARDRKGRGKKRARSR